MSWQEDDELARLRVENEKLRELLAKVRALAGVPRTNAEHIYEGRCPDEFQPNSRDPYCWACMAMDGANKQETSR